MLVNGKSFQRDSILQESLNGDIERTSTSSILLLHWNRYMNVPVVLPIELRQMTHDRGVLSGREVCTASRFADPSLSPNGGLDGGLGGIEARIGDVSPSGGDGRSGAREDFHVRHGWICKLSSGESWSGHEKDVSCAGS